jgi:hypothetical protein
MVQSIPITQRASSPFDRYISQALQLVHEQGDIPVVELVDRYSTEFHWLPGFAEVIVSFLRTNRLITINEWEPGTLRIARNGQAWLASSTTMSSDPS